MDSSLVAILTTLGIPGLIYAIGYAIRQWGDSKVKVANAVQTTANAEKLRAEAAVLEGEASRAREETTGRFAKVAEGAIAAARHDLSECEKVREELRGELAEERREREELAKRCDAREEECARELGRLEGRIEELERRSQRPGGA